jgi:hypothetical protein
VIGVISRAEQRVVVEEFFELFKTPWEHYEAGRAYDVVITTTGEVANSGGARLVVLFGSQPQKSDARYGIAPLARRLGGWVSRGPDRLPIYGELLSFSDQSTGRTCLSGDAGIAGIRVAATNDRALVRLGYDLFDEVRILLSQGQPAEHAQVPTLDLHIDLLRQWIVGAGVELIEILPTPAGNAFVVCLTHDIDFIGIRRHFLDHSMWGFLYRSTVGAVHGFLKRRLSFARALVMWRAAMSLPFVYLGLVKDFWEPFGWYLRIEKGLPATYFVIPYKRRAGEHVPGRHASRRAGGYDITDIADWTRTLAKHGCEIGVHGIDAWHSEERGRDEIARITGVTGDLHVGIRMHWLLQDDKTADVLDRAGYRYDSTVGYNDAVGYRAGTGQVFRPIGVTRLLELPMHIQDGALFYPQRMNLSEPEAWERCQTLIDHARRFGGVLTVLWHDRSHSAERLWGDFYIGLVDALKASHAWFATAADVVEWFRSRRQVRFERRHMANGRVTSIRTPGTSATPAFTIRVYAADQSDARGASAFRFTDTTWDGAGVFALDHEAMFHS